MSENTENVKKIRELEDFDTSVPISEKDYLIIATNEDADGDGNNERIPLTKKATIAQAVEVYNNSIATPPSEPSDPSIPVWSNSTSYNVGDKVVYNNKVYECIKAHTSSIPQGGSGDIYWELDEAGNAPDPEDQPGYEETDPVTGQPVKRITTPVNGGNLDNFLDPDGGLKTVDFCQDANKEEVACDGSEGEVKYKTKKLALDIGSGNGFQGYDAQFQYGFPKTLKRYSGGILTEISYDIGKLLEHFIPYTSSGDLMPKWFVGLTANQSPNFGMIIWAQSGSGNNFEEVGQGSYVFSPAWGFMYLNVGALQLSTDFVQNFWLYDRQIGWVWVSMLEYPYVYVNTDLFNTGSPTGWIYAKDDNSGNDLSSNIYVSSHPDGAKWVAKSTLADIPVDPNVTPGPIPTRAVTSIVPS